MKRPPDLEDLKRQAAARAVALIADRMVVGLGTGSTAKHAVELLAQRLHAGDVRGVTGVPTSVATQRQAAALGIELVDLPVGGVDVAVDGMDELAVTQGRLDAVKGLGGALLREKIVAESAREFVLIGDETKRVGSLGERSPLPVEIARFGWRHTLGLLGDLATRATLRRVADEPFVSDNGNYIVDCTLEPGYDALALQATLDGLAGVVGHGLFLGVARVAYLATSAGVVELAADTSLGASATP